MTIDDQTQSFTVHGQTDHCPYRLARRLAETTVGDLIDWALDEDVAKLPCETQTEATR